jgi:hypothetical protein
MSLPEIPVIRLPRVFRRIGMVCPCDDDLDRAILLDLDAAAVTRLMRGEYRWAPATKAPRLEDRRTKIVRPAPYASVISLADPALRCLTEKDSFSSHILRNGGSVAIHDSLALAARKCDTGRVLVGYEPPSGICFYSVGRKDAVVVHVDYSAPTYLAGWLLGMEREPIYGSCIYRGLFVAAPELIADHISRGAALPGAPETHSGDLFTLSDFDLKNRMGVSDGWLEGIVATRPDRFHIT